MTIPVVPGSNSNMSPQHNEQTVLTARVLNSPAGISAARIDWVPATISNVLTNNVNLLRTPFGEMSIKTMGSNLNIGDKIFFKYDSKGDIQIKPNLNLIQNNLPKENIPLGSKPLSPNYLSISVSNLEPVKGMPIPGTMNNINIAQTNKMVSSIFPHINNVSFSYAASLFPQTVRGGLLSRVAINDERKIILSGRLSDMVEKALINPAPKIDGSYGWVSWNMPFFDSGFFYNSKWLVRDEEHDDDVDGKKDVRHTVIELNTEIFGNLQLSCLTFENQVDIEIISEHIIPEIIRDEITSTAVAIANILNLHTRVTFGFGKDKQFNISETD